MASVSPLKLTLILREATGSQEPTRTSHKAQRSCQIALVTSQEDSLQDSGLFETGSQQCQEGSGFSSNWLCREERHSELAAEQMSLPSSLAAHARYTDISGFRGHRCSGVEPCSLHLLSKRRLLSSMQKGSFPHTHFLQSPPWARQLSLLKPSSSFHMCYSVSCLTQSGVTGP